jgi:hypothetical protein
MHGAVGTKAATYLIQTQYARGQLNSRMTTHYIILNPWTRGTKAASLGTHIEDELGTAQPGVEFGKVSTSLQNISYLCRPRTTELVKESQSLIEMCRHLTEKVISYIRYLQNLRLGSLSYFFLLAIQNDGMDEHHCLIQQLKTPVFPIIPI